MFKTVQRTRIGSPFVIERINDLLAQGYRTVCEFEANGGFLLATPAHIEGRRIAPLPTRDAVLPMISVLAEARRRGVKLSALVAELPSRYTYRERLENYAISRSGALITRLREGEPNAVLARLTDMLGELAGSAVGLDEIDGLRATFESGDIIHLRPSGNAPELRCYTESASSERATWIGQEVLALIAKMD